MAGLLCAEAGWWQLELLLGRLARQAEAGVRPELFSLMEVRAGGLEGRRAPDTCVATSTGFCHARR
jgi:hypothetical protein